MINSSKSKWEQTEVDALTDLRKQGLTFSEISESLMNRFGKFRSIGALHQKMYKMRDDNVICASVLSDSDLPAVDLSPSVSPKEETENIAVKSPETTVKINVTDGAISN